MKFNPYPKEIQDETSGVMVPNQRHLDWNEGWNALVEHLRELDEKAGDAAAFRVMVRHFSPFK